MNNDLLIKWLKSTHALEESIVTLLNSRLSDTEGYSEIYAGIEQHQNETEQQAERLEKDIERLGDSVSKTREAASKASGKMQDMMSGFGDDKLIDNSMSDFALENYEIATYLTLIELADAASEQETVQVCQQNLDEEREMASWLEENFPSAVHIYLSEQSEEEE